jgi:hypothetical protein
MVAHMMALMQWLIVGREVAMGRLVVASGEEVIIQPAGKILAQTLISCIVCMFEEYGKV